MRSHVTLHLLQMALNSRVSFFYFSISLIYCIAANASSEKNIGHLLETLGPNLLRQNEVALVTLTGYWNADNGLLLRNLPFAVSLWTLPTTSFDRHIRDNLVAGMKTNVLAINLGHYSLRYLPRCPTSPVNFALVDCMLIEIAPNETYGRNAKIINTRMLSCANNSHCRESEIGTQCLYLPRTLAHSVSTRDCRRIPANNQQNVFRQSELRNQRVYIGCTVNARYGSDCENTESMIVISGLLRFYNASITWFFSSNLRVVTDLLLSGKIDIMGNTVYLNHHFPHMYSVDQITKQRYETFYAYRAAFELTPFSNVLTESKQVFCFLLAAIVCTSLVLTFADIAERAARPSCSLVQSFLFLLAYFYANSLPIPRRKRLLRTRSVVYGVWFIALLPLSNYLRSELVSRLSVRSREGVIDTFEKLGNAVSRKAIAPCMLLGTLTHGSVTHNMSYTKLHDKLSEAFYAAKDRKSLVAGNIAGCLSCAKKRHSVCFTQSLSKCLLDTNRGAFDESKDKLNEVLSGLIARKNFPLKVAFRNMVRIARELGFIGVYEKRCDGKHVIDDSLSPTEESVQMKELGRFLLLFVLLLAASAAVVIIELIIGKATYLCHDSLDKK